MWQHLVVGILVVAGLVVVVRHFVKTFRGETSHCSGCSGACSLKTARGLQGLESSAPPPTCEQSSSPR